MRAMLRSTPIATIDATDAAALLAQKDASITALTQQVAALQHQLDWFRRQLFGRKSERVVPIDPQQMVLGDAVPPPDASAAVAQKPVAAHTRKAPRRDVAADAEAVPFFDESKVPIIEIGLSTPEIEALSPDQYEVIGEKVS